MNEFKKGDIIVSLKEQKSSSRDEPVVIKEGYISENISPEDPLVVFFKETIPAKGCYLSKNFRLATEEEKIQFIKGRKLVEPVCPFDEEYIIVAEENIISVENNYTLFKGTIAKIEGIIKTKDMSKSIMYLYNQPGFFKTLDKFRLATIEEIITFESELTK